MLPGYNNINYGSYGCFFQMEHYLKEILRETCTLSKIVDKGVSSAVWKKGFYAYDVPIGIPFIVGVKSGKKYLYIDNDSSIPISMQRSINYIATEAIIDMQADDVEDLLFHCVYTDNQIANSHKLPVYKNSIKHVVIGVSANDALMPHNIAQAICEEYDMPWPEYPIFKGIKLENTYKSMKHVMSNLYLEKHFQKRYFKQDSNNNNKISNIAILYPNFLDINGKFQVSLKFITLVENEEDFLSITKIQQAYLDKVIRFRVSKALKNKKNTKCMLDKIVKNKINIKDPISEQRKQLNKLLKDKGYDKLDIRKLQKGFTTYYEC